MGHECERCERKKTCNAFAAEEYKKFDAKRKNELKKRYLCKQVNGLCHMDKCSSFAHCTKPEKTNYKEWVEAYQNNNKELLKKIIKGGH